MQEFGPLALKPCAKGQIAVSSASVHCCELSLLNKLLISKDVKIPLMKISYKILQPDVGEEENDVQAEDTIPGVSITLRKLSLHLHNFKFHTQSDKLNKLLSIGMTLTFTSSDLRMGDGGKENLVFLLSFHLLFSPSLIFFLC